MALAVAQVVGEVGGGTSAITKAVTSTGSGSLIVVTAGTNNAGNPVLSITDNQGNTYVRASRSLVNRSAEVWYAKNCTAAVTSVTVNFTSSVASTQGGINIYEITGASIYSPYDNSSTGSGADTGAPLTLSVTSFTPSVADTIVIGAGALTVSPTWSAGASYTGGVSEGRHYSVYRILSSASAQTAPLVASVSSSSWDAAAACFKISGDSAPDDNQVQGVFGEFKPVFDIALGALTANQSQGVFGEFKPVLDSAQGVSPPAVTTSIKDILASGFMIHPR